jgi:drug/metabolite transporter (DMT)-like permease
MTGAGRVWPAALAAVSGSALVGTMPLAARTLYAEGLGAPSMLFWRYAIALVALAVAGAIMRIDLLRAARGGAWRPVLVGATLGTAQTLCFWESLKTLETGIAVLLFYTYPAVTLALDRLVFNEPIRKLALFCIAVILVGAGLITAPGLRGGTIDPGGLLWALPSPLVYAIYLAINSRLLRHHPPLIGALGLFAGMGLSFAAAALVAGLDVPASAAGWLLVLFIALGPGALTMTLFSFSVPRLGAGSFAILANAELVTGGVDRRVGARGSSDPLTSHRRRADRRRHPYPRARPPCPSPQPSPRARGEGWTRVSGRVRGCPPLCRLQQAPQHVLQDAAVAEIFDFVERVDAADDRLLTHPTRFVVDPQRQVHPRLEARFDPDDVERLVAGQL